MNIVLIGMPGSGKTTICNLISRFWDCQDGQILLGGVDIREMSFEQLISNISVVFQKIYLFNDTIYNNIAFGKINASREEIMEAARKARCYDFIMALPDGFDTMVGEGGATLSGGEKQMLAMARGLMSGPKLCLFDELSYGLAPIMVNEVFKIVQMLRDNGITVLLVEQNVMQSMEIADRAYVLENGRISLEGKCSELIDNDYVKRAYPGL